MITIKTNLINMINKRISKGKNKDKEIKIGIHPKFQASQIAKIIKLIGLTIKTMKRSIRKTKNYKEVIKDKRKVKKVTEKENKVVGTILPQEDMKNQPN